MGLPFFENGPRKKREAILAVDLGSRNTKAVHIQRRGDELVLCGYAQLDAPIVEKTLSRELLTEHLKALGRALDTKTRLVSLTVGVNDSLVRTADLPRMTRDDLRMVLKTNSKTYLQQDLAGYVFDCEVLPTEAAPEKNAEPAKGGMPKHRVLVAGARQQQIEDYDAAARAAGLVPDRIIPGLVGPVNAFERAMPEMFQNETVAIIDLGFRTSSICILHRGELVLSRVVAIAGDRLTTTLSETMNISYAEAEGIKVGMAHEVQSTLETVLTPLGRELRASIDFFEHQQDKTVSHVLVSGGCAGSELILQSLRTELMVDCKSWNPTSFLKVEVPPHQVAALEQVAPQLAVAVGAAVAAF
jgi:type IV pilus assembly protein PilM